MTSLGDRMVAGAPYALLAAGVAWVVKQTAVPLHDPDSWWHLRLGEDFLHQRSLAPPAHWSSFATSTWVPSQPLSEIVAALVNRAFGLPGLVWTYSAFVLLVVLVVYLASRGQGSPLPAAVATLVFVAVGEGELTPRPQLASYVLLVLVVAVWLRTEQDLRPRWWLVPLSWAWSLCHGFWFVGVGYGVLGVVAIALGRRATRGQLAKLAVVPVASAAVVLLNPVGPGVFLAPFLVSQRTRYITEWQRSDLLSGPALVVLLAAAAVSVIWASRRGGVTWLRVLMLLSVPFFDWYAVRTVILAGIVLAPLLTGALESLIANGPDARSTGPGRRERLGVGLGAVTVLAFVALVVPNTATRPGRVPLALDGALSRLPAGTTVFDDYTLGGWLAWRHPQLNRYIDGLADAYPVSHLRHDASIASLDPGWQRELRRTGATVALIADGSAMARGLAGSGWTSQGTGRGWVLLTAPSPS